MKRLESDRGFAPDFSGKRVAERVGFEPNPAFDNRHVINQITSGAPIVAAPLLYRSRTGGQPGGAR